MNRSYSVVIVDDEPLARRRVRRMLDACEGVHCVGVAADIASARELIERVLPDILLLDIQMPGGDGFELLRSLEGKAPLTVFLTAFDQHAVKAFEVNAVDYLLKPVEPDRLNQALARVRHLLLPRESDAEVRALRHRLVELHQSLKGPRADEAAELWIRSAEGYQRISTLHISRIHAERDYVRIHAHGRAFLHWESMASLESRLGDDEFIRVHRGSIVRRDCIARIRRGSFSGLVVELSDGTDVAVGRTYMSRVRAQFRL